MEPRSKHFRKRDAILAYLRQSGDHPSAETVYAGLKQEIPDISLGTVYRNLALFKEQELIQSLGSVKGVERFDGRTGPHVHFICTGCGRVRDLEDIQIPQELRQEASNQSHGVIRQCQLTFLGECEACAEKSNM